MVKLTDNEETSQGSSEHLILLIGDQDTVRSRDGLGGIGNKRDVQLANATVLALGARPRQVGVVRIRGDRKNLSVDGLKLEVLLAERDNLSLVDESA